jgi:hypothetical protein
MSKVLNNVTITLDDETLARARVKAAERNLSLSRFVGEVLREQMRGDDEYERAMRRFLSRKPQALLRPGERYFTREEVNDRAALRKLEEAERKKGKRS